MSMTRCMMNSDHDSGASVLILFNPLTHKVKILSSSSERNVRGTEYEKEQRRPFYHVNEQTRVRAHHRNSAGRSKLRASAAMRHATVIFTA